MLALNPWYTQTYSLNLTEIIQTLSLHSLEKMKLRKATSSHRWGIMFLLLSCECFLVWEMFFNIKCIDSGPMYLLTMLHHVQNLSQLTPVEEEKRERCQKSWSRSFRKSGRTAEGTGRITGLVFGPEVQSHEAAREEGTHREGFYFIESQFLFNQKYLYMREQIYLSLNGWDQINRLISVFSAIRCMMLFAP